MSELRCIQVSTKRELDQAVALRWSVFAREVELVGGGARRELDEWDTLDSTLHWVVSAGAEPVATVRLLLPPPGAALPFHAAFALVGGPRALASAAQAGRVCVEPRWRRSSALLLLFGAMYAASRARGVTHWLAPVNCRTDHPVDAELVYRAALARGLGCEGVRARPRPHLAPPASPRHRLYGARERAAPPLALPLPGPVRLCASKLAAQCLGPPAMDPGFGRYALPMLIAVRDIPARTVRLAPGPVAVTGGAA